MEEFAGNGLELSLPEALHPVVHRLLADTDALTGLGACYDPRDFIAKLGEFAAAQGLPFDVEMAHGVLRPDPLGLGRFAAAPINVRRWPGAGWLPSRALMGPDGLYFDWLWFGPGMLTQPFFEDELRRTEPLPINWLLRSRMSLEDLIAGAAAVDTPPLKGLIYHTSRCGSTLLARMLRTIAGTTVSSEPEPLDGVLRWIAATAPPEDLASAALMAIVGALGRRLGEDVRAHVIKLEPWQSLFMPELNAAFPETPWVFQHRDPLEVLVSQVKTPGVHVIPDALDAGRLGFSGMHRTPTDHAARVLGKYAAVAVENWDQGRGLSLAYRDLVPHGAAAAARHFELELGQSGTDQLARAAQHNAKAPGELFTSDVAQKRAAANELMRAAAEEWMTVPFAQLEAIHAKQRTG